MTAGPDIRAIAVVVPAHDEEELLGPCLEALRIAAARLRRVRTEIVVALDACTDSSAVIARRGGAHVVELDARSVGAARRAGLDAALALLPDLDAEEIWTAHTDADSTVPANWLTRQVRAARAGADVFVGTVRPDFGDLDDRQRAAWAATHTPGVANGHVHGASLGMRASTLRAAGGFDDVPEHEDVALVARARALGARVLASDDAWVLTSGRTHGRTPGGYARYLREDLVRRAAELT